MPEIAACSACTAAGTPLPDAQRVRTDALLLARFWQKVVPAKGGCLLWRAGKNEHGYGLFHIKREDGTDMAIRATRVMWLLIHGSWPPADLMLLHSCDNRACVNPAHLRLGTASENNKEMYERNRRERSCKSGGIDDWPNGIAPKKMLKGKSKLSAKKVRELREQFPHGKMDEIDAAMASLQIEEEQDGAFVRPEAIQRAVEGKTFGWV